ncbi:MAG: hypothetical protein QE271_08340 [Bacteriovoracaceae bacterium]|nr:hypothetical protein [Bacteriovoracaceae bacterium]
MENFRGQVWYYRIYDIGHEVNMVKAVELLNLKNLTEQFKLKRPNRSLIIDQAPIVISLGEITYEVFGRKFPLKAYGKLWNFGALSLTFRIIIKESIPISTFKNIANVIENDEYLEKMARKTLDQLLIDMGEAIKRPRVWEQFEDYLIFNLDPSENSDSDLSHLLQSNDFYQLILTETNINLSQSVKDSIRNFAVQYSDKDLTVVDWNSALVCSTEDFQDICDVIEFGQIQLLEMRYHDDQLDKKLSALNKAIQETKPSIFSNKYKNIAQDAAKFFIDISDIKEKIDNSLKVVGDVHYAKIFRLAIDKFRLREWNVGINEKLENLKEVALIFQNEVNERRNMLMEITVIALIAVEVIPLIVSLISKFLS